MKIVHLMLSCFYKEGYGYQENILPQKHRELGHEVQIVTNTRKSCILPISVCHRDAQPFVYKNSDGIDVYVLAPHRKNPIETLPYFSHFFPFSDGLSGTLEQLKPDLIFCHGYYCAEYKDVVAYKEKHPDCRIIMDNHADYYNTPVRRDLRSLIINKIVVRPIVSSMIGIAEKIWGVTPWRVKYMIEEFQSPVEKTKLLVMGGDEKYIDWSNRKTTRATIRERLNISEDAFVVISGGKIDKTKNIHLLIEAFHSMSNMDIFLLVFGNMTEDMRKICEPLFSDKIINLGWIDSNLTYQYFHASDLGCFPGTHSVLWEQACACGLPCIFKDWDGGFSHVDVGGNCIFIKEPTTQKLSDCIMDTFTNKEVYNRMKSVAQSIAHTTFSYREIAKRSIN